MKKKFLAGIITMTLLLLVGCGAKENEQLENVQPENVQSENAVTEDIKEEVIEQIPLSEEELQEWTGFVNNRTNNGFLLSYYNSPDEADLNEVFYSGCGLDQEPMSEAEIEAYLEASEAEEIYTECTKLTTTQIETALQKHLGLSMDKMKKPLEWVYLEEFDCYINQHGDTNAMNFNCISGYQQGNQVILNCEAMYGDMPGGWGCRVTLQKAEDDTWRFVSNEKLENIEGPTRSREPLLLNRTGGPPDRIRPLCSAAAASSHARGCGSQCRLPADSSS